MGEELLGILRAHIRSHPRWTCGHRRSVLFLWSLLFLGFLSCLGITDLNLNVLVLLDERCVMNTEKSHEVWR